MLTWPLLPKARAGSSAQRISLYALTVVPKDNTYTHICLYWISDENEEKSEKGCHISAAKGFQNWIVEEILESVYCIIRWSRFIFNSKWGNQSVKRLLNYCFGKMPPEGVEVSWILISVFRLLLQKDFLYFLPIFLWLCQLLHDFGIIRIVEEGIIFRYPKMRY